MSKPDNDCPNLGLNQPSILSKVKPHLVLAFRDPTMPQPHFKFASVPGKRRRSGMTLIELLVAISILVIIAAILVPQLRLATADRNLREASRTVASLFAQASQRAINDGEAGIVIERNPNIVAANGTAYAGTSLFLLRKSPRYTGDDESDVAELVRESQVDWADPPLEANQPDVSDTDVYITLPAEQETLQIVQVDDRISFVSQPNIRFIITAVQISTDIVDNVEKLRLSLRSPSDFLNFKDIFNFSEDTEVTEDSGDGAGSSQQIIGPFVIYRKPRKLVSSRVDLPTGFLIDLRLSGETNSAGNQIIFDQDDRPIGTDAAPNSIIYLFNGRGAIDRFFYSITLPNGTASRAFNKPSQPAYLMVREYNPDEFGEVTDEILGTERTMWVTVDPDSGASNVVSGVPINTADFATTKLRLRAARSLSSQGQQAAQ